MHVLIVIPTFKRNPITAQHLRCPFPHDVVLSRMQGLSSARNDGAKHCTTHDLLMFIDDDVMLDARIWEQVKRVKQGKFGMVHIQERCSSRFMVIHPSDFWRIGGFNEALQYLGEDIDFYIRADKAGLKYRGIPEAYVHHVTHERRWKNPNLNVHIHFEQAKLIVLHNRQYFWFYKAGWTGMVRSWLRNPRTCFPTVIGIPYFILRSIFQ